MINEIITFRVKSHYQDSCCHSLVISSFDQLKWTLNIVSCLATYQSLKKLGVVKCHPKNALLSFDNLHIGVFYVCIAVDANQFLKNLFTWIELHCLSMGDINK